MSKMSHRIYENLTSHSYGDWVTPGPPSQLCPWEHLHAGCGIVEPTVLRGGSAVGHWTCHLQVAGSIPGRWLSRNVGQLSLAPPWIAKSSTCFGWG